jgi:hypothetical protein
MALGFLANLGRGVASLGSAFGRSAASIGKGIGQGVKRLGQLGDEGDDLGPGGTPTFMPGQGRLSGASPRIVEDAVASAENNARAEFGSGAETLLERRNLPITSRDPLTAPIPTQPAIGAAVGSAPRTSGFAPSPALLPSLPTPRPPSPVAALGAAPSMAGPGPERIPDRSEIPIPRLPGKSGGPVPYNTADAARYDSVMSHAKRDAKGDLLGPDEGGGFNRDWKMSLRNAFLGASQAAAANPRDPLGAALGGALTAGAGSAINPQAGYEFAFDAGERPKMEAEMERGRKERAQAMAERIAEMDARLKQGQVDQIPIESERQRVGIAKAQSDIEIARQNAERQKAVADSQIEYNKARIEALRTGKPVYRDLVGSDGQIQTYQILPDGSMTALGGSAQAAISGERNKSAERRAETTAGASTANTAVTVAGAKERTQMQIDAANKGGGSKLKKPSGGAPPAGGGKTKTAADVRAAAKRAGISEAEGLKRAAKAGYTIKD